MRWASVWVKTDGRGLWWYCFLALFLLTVSRPQPCCLGPWRIFHPPCMTVHVTQLLLSCPCPWERTGTEGAFYQHPNLHWQAFSLWMAQGPPLFRGLLLIVVSVIIIITVISICTSVPHRCQNIVWSFILITSLWDNYSSGVLMLERLPPSQDHIVLKLDLNPVRLTPVSPHFELVLYVTTL